MLIFILLPLIYSKLLGVIEFNRHGARTPKEFTHLSEELFYSSSSSHLTLNGYTQVTYLGKWLKDRYSKEYKLLNEDFKKDETLFISSPISRSIFSAVGIINAMYPGEIVIPKWEGNEQLRSNDMPPIKDLDLNITDHITLNVRNQDDDNLFHTDTCRLSEKGIKIKDMIPSEEVVTFTNEELKKALDDVKLKAPVIFNEIPFEYGLEPILTLCGFFLPVNYHYNGNLYNLEKETIETLRKGQIYKMYKKRVVESQYQKIIISPVFDQFKKNLLGFSNNSSKVKFILLSGHDTNLVDLLVNILDKKFLKQKFTVDDKDYNFIMPQFASSFLVELHTTGHNNLKSQKFVRIIYNGENLKSGLNKKLKYDNEIDGIPFDNFMSYLNQNIDPSYKSLFCKSSTLETEILADSFLLEIS